MAAGFDTFLFADYSGAADPSAQKRAITLWRLDRGRRARKVRGPFTRASLRAARLEGWILGAALLRSGATSGVA